MLFTQHDFLLLVCKDHKVTKFVRLHETFFAWCMASFYDGTLACCMYSDVQAKLQTTSLYCFCTCKYKQCVLMSFIPSAIAWFY